MTSGNQAGLDVNAGTGSVLAVEAKSGGGADAAGVGTHAQPPGEAGTTVVCVGRDHPWSSCG